MCSMIWCGLSRISSALFIFPQGITIGFVSSSSVDKSSLKLINFLFKSVMIYMFLLSLYSASVSLCANFSGSAGVFSSICVSVWVVVSYVVFKFCLIMFFSVLFISFCLDSNFLTDCFTLIMFVLISSNLFSIAVFVSLTLFLINVVLSNI